MKVTVEFDTGNAAFEDDMQGQVGEIMEQASAFATRWAHSLGQDGPGGTVTEAMLVLRDVNGNSVGKVEVTE